MNKFILIIIFQLFIIQISKAQVFQSSGKIGKPFLEIINYQELDNSKFKNRNEKKFAVEVDFEMRNFLNSGRVIYNCEASEYVEKVADKLLKNNQNLRKELSFYIVKSTDVNAFTYNNGMVFIHVGLLANVKSEAQLAFILAHEISHYQLHHSFEKYKQSKIQQKKAAKSNGDGAEAFLNLMSYSREKELEADKNGLKLYLQSDYASTASLGVFEVLKFADYPLENKLILRESFETPFFKISPIIFPDTASLIQNIEDANDSLSTHPNILNRITNIKKELKTTAEKGSNFLVSENQFNQIKRAARIELSNIYLLERNYIGAFYNSFVLLEEEPQNKELMLSELKALFFIQNYLNQNLKSKIALSPKKIKGEIQKLHAFFNKAQKSDMNAFILRLSWRLRSSLGNDPDAIKFSNYCIKDFGTYVSNNLSHFKPISEFQDTLFVHNYEYNKNVSNKGSKTGLKSLKRKSEYPHYSISHFAMSDFIDDKTFKQTFEEVTKGLESKTNDDSESKENEEEKDEALITKRKSAFAKKEKPLIDEAIKDLLVVDINNLFFDLRKEDPLRYLTVKEKQIELSNLIQETSKLNGVNVHVFNPIELNEDDSAIYTERVAMKNWIKSRLIGDEYEYADSKEQAMIKKIMDKYNAKHICFINSIAVLDQKEVGENQIGIFCLSFLVPPLPIYFGYQLFKPLKASGMYIPIYNLENGKIAYKHEQYFNDLNKIDFTRSEFYNFFYIISKNAYK
jgi:Zn-dependent protease with chaperone function